MKNRNFILCNVVLNDAIPSQDGGRIVNLVAIPKQAISAIMDTNGDRSSWRVFLKLEYMETLPFDFETLVLSNNHYKDNDNVEDNIDDTSIQMI